MRYLICQPASCELLLWLVRLVWHSASAHCHLVSKRSGTRSARSAYHQFLIAQNPFREIPFDQNLVNFDQSNLEFGSISKRAPVPSATSSYPYQDNLSIASSSYSS